MSSTFTTLTVTVPIYFDLQPKLAFFLFVQGQIFFFFYLCDSHVSGQIMNSGRLSPVRSMAGSFPD